jgi:plastocyanin
MRALPLLLLLLLGAGPGAPAGTVTGAVVAVKGGKPVKPEYAYVYLQPVRPARGKPPGTGLTFEIHQKEKQFVPHVLVVPTGSVVRFPNDDRETHNVFSPNGPPEQFDLGRSNTNEGPSRHFDDPGEVELYCDIHREMWAKVKVVDTPYVAQVVDGKYTFGNVAPGTYRVIAWAPSSNEVVAPEKVTVTAGQTATVKELHLQIAPIRTTHARKDGRPYCPDGYADC